MTFGQSIRTTHSDPSVKTLESVTFVSALLGLPGMKTLLVALRAICIQAQNVRVEFINEMDWIRSIHCVSQEEKEARRKTCNMKSTRDPRRAQASPG